MLRNTVSKLKRICSIILIPRILQGDLKCGTLKDLAKYSLYEPRVNKTTKSTDNPNKEGTVDSDQTDDVTKANYQKSVTDNIQKAIAERNEVDCEICNRIINKIFDVRQNLTEQEIEEYAKNEAIYQATTKKVEEDQLAQKIEKLEESRSFEVQPKFERPHVAPPVLGEQEQMLRATSDTNKTIGNIDYDAIARRCLDAPSNEVDNRILNEIEKEREIYMRKGLQSDLYIQDNIDTTLKMYSDLDKWATTDYQPATEHYSLGYDRTEQCIYKAEITQPLLLDSMTLYTLQNEDLDIDDIDESVFHVPLLQPYDNQTIPFYDYEFKDQSNILELPVEGNQHEIANDSLDSENFNESMITSPSTLNPYNNENVSFYDYGFKEIKLDLPKEEEEESITVTEVVGEDSNSISPTEAELEVKPDIINSPASEAPDQPAEVVLEDSRQPTEVLEAPDDKNIVNREQISHITGLANDGIVYAKKNQSDIPPQDPAALDNKFDITVKPNTAISAQKPLDKKQRHSSNSNTAISANQPADEFYKHTIPTDIKELDKNIEMENMALSTRAEQLSERNDDVELSNEFIDKRELVRNFIFDPPEKSQMREKKCDFSRAKTQNIDRKIATATGPLPNLSYDDNALTLKELLRRIRLRHQHEYCRGYMKEAAKLQMDFDSLSQSSVKPLGPPTCKPKPKEKPSPTPPKCPPSECPKDKKDPCAKFISSLPLKIQGSFAILRLYLTDPVAPMINFQRSYSTQTVTTFSECDEIKTSLSDSCHRNVIRNVNDFIFPKDYEPWTPIPSWPIPKNKKRHPLVCPKEGCKVIPPPHPNDRCDPNNPCKSFPKKIFSISNL